MLPIKGVIKNYHWGRTDPRSILVSIVNSKPWANLSRETIDSSKPLAELWLGTHPSGMSQIYTDPNNIDSSLTLVDFFRADPSLCGNVNQVKKYGLSLPYLFKVLSVDQALSLQAHPDKKLAIELHARDPKNYPDFNHKPEMAIALSEFEVLCDVRAHDVIVHFITTIEPLQNVIGVDNLSNLNNAYGNNDKESTRQALLSCFSHMLNVDRSQIGLELKNLMSSSSILDELPTDIVYVLKKLYNLYPTDPGCFSVFFLNFIRLKPGEAIYLEPMRLHAYIHGDCIECMACSDNVVRAGLTTKFCDVETLTKMLEFQETTPDSLILKPQQMKNYAHDKDCVGAIIDTFAPPVDEFKVDKIIIDDGQAENGKVVLPATPGGSILIVLQGTATVEHFLNANKKQKLEFGFTGFMPPHLSFTLTEVHDKFVAFRAYC